GARTWQALRDVFARTRPGFSLPATGIQCNGPVFRSPKRFPHSRSGRSGPARGPGGQLPKAVWPRGREVVWTTQTLNWIALEDRALAATGAESVAATSARPDRSNRTVNQSSKRKRGTRPHPSLTLGARIDSGRCREPSGTRASGAARLAAPTRIYSRTQRKRGVGSCPSLTLRALIHRPVAPVRSGGGRGHGFGPGGREGPILKSNPVKGLGRPDDLAATRPNRLGELAARPPGRTGSPGP